MPAFGAGLGVAAALVVSVPLLIAGSLGALPADPCVNGIAPSGYATAVPTSTSATGLNATQLGHASTIIAAGRTGGIPEQGIVVALATALQESWLRVYANDGTGDLAADQAGIAASLDLPHEAVGRDHGSLGIFQQQWPWWGSMDELMDPATSARLFYDALLEVPSWEELPVTVAAQSVQRSAYPSAYADDEPLARRLLVDLAARVVGTGQDCIAQPGGGVVRFPLPADSGYVDQRNFAARGTSWASWHTGTDLSVACGTPVYAAHAGTVELLTDQAWSGPWLVKIAVAPGRLTTWYAHLQTVGVADGDWVDSGTQIGEVGALGNATGCHLHLEVHPRGGSIYEDPIDPSQWLAENVGTDLGGPRLGRVASFNVLGHSHTEPGGKRPQMASGRVRIRWAIDLLEQHRIDVVGLQEFQRVQARAFRRAVRNRWELWHAPDDTQDAVAWRTDVWEAVDRRLTPIPYFGGRIRHMPVVKLKHLTTGEQVWVVSVHNPADTGFSPHNERHRREALRREIALSRSLISTTGVTVIFMGDLNARSDAFCRVTADGLLSAAAGGSHVAGRCRPPPFKGIDWIFSGPGVTWSGWTVDRSSAVRRTTDHPLVFATLTSLG